jgi:hypothetical protein
MSLGSLARSLVRYFRPAATSVSPQITPVGVSMTLSFAPFSPASAPPKAPEAPSSPSAKPWAEWGEKIANHYTPAGWTFCKFGLRGPGAEDGGEVFGIVKNGYGAYWCRFYIYVPETNFRGAQYLAVAANVRSGYAIGIFANMIIATDAAEIAMRLSQHEGLDGNPDAPDTNGAFQLLSVALGAAGYTMAQAACRPMAGDDVIAGSPIPVWIRTDAERPAEVMPS